MHWDVSERTLLRRWSRRGHWICDGGVTYYKIDTGKGSVKNQNRSPRRSGEIAKCHEDRTGPAESHNQCSCRERTCWLMLTKLQNITVRGQISNYNTTIVDSLQTTPTTAVVRNVEIKQTRFFLFLPIAQRACFRIVNFCWNRYSANSASFCRNRPFLSKYE